MSEKNFILNQIRDLEAIRRAMLERADDADRAATQASQDRDRPSDPTRTLEHRAACDQRAAEQRNSAASARRTAEQTLNQIRGLERSLR